MRQLTLAATLALCTLAFAADNPPADGKWIDLFDGKTLDGWKVIGCQAEVQDGAIFLKAGNGVVRTEKKYADYTVEWECKALKDDNWDSGVYFRCIDPAGSYPWPRKYQVNMRKGMEGNCDELKGAKSTGLAKDHEWNRFKLTVVGAKAELEINGKPAWKADGVTEREGFISIQAEVPGGGQYLYRNIRLMELKSR